MTNVAAPAAAKKARVKTAVDVEFQAIKSITRTLESLDVVTKARVLNYVANSNGWGLQFPVPKPQAPAAGAPAPQAVM